MGSDKKRSLRLFVDFDGTVTTRDVGHAVFSRFLPREKVESGWHTWILGEWKAGRMSSRECLTLECNTVQITRDELDTELDGFSLTPGFAETIHWCSERAVPVMVLSDGLDYYIEYILEKYGLGDLEYHANSIRFENGSLGVEFPSMEHGCGRCGNCKRWHIESRRRDGDIIVYAGDGYSDRFAVRSADMVFARADLAAFCDAEGIEYTPFETFFDVLEVLDEREKTL